MKKFIFITLLFSVLIAFTDELTGKVIKVSDGDTITILDNENQVYHVRLDKIDAPEKKQEYGFESKQYLKSLIWMKDVLVKYNKKDRYNRILGIIYCNEQEINLMMVENGFAWHYKHFDKSINYIMAEKQAKENKVGLWKSEHPIEPYQFRKYKKSNFSRKKRKK